jgi:hypothetical protein
MKQDHILPTVKIDDGNGSYIVINESDFDSAKHKKFGEEKPKRGPKPKKAAK